MSYLYTGAEWDIPLLEKIWDNIDTIGKEFGLDYPEASIEIITFDQMIANCSTHAMPAIFDHWIFGLSEMQSMHEYKKTGSGLAFEVVINTDPAIAYCQENNSATMQTLVMAHAICGHGSFFKNNYMFRQFTEAKHILKYLNRFKEYIKECEEIYGQRKVEFVLDACFALDMHSFDTRPKPNITSDQLWEMMIQRLHHNEERDREKESSLPNRSRDLQVENREAIDLRIDNDFYERQENVLALIAKHSLKLRPWQKKIVEAFCQMSQYFYPQYLTQVANEGWATFWHYHILQEMHNRGLIPDASWLEAVDSHCSVIYQPNYSQQINPYALGFNMFMDIKRISETPDKEDKKLFPQLAGKPWLDNLHWAMENYNDSSFIMQYLSPKVVKKMNFMSLEMVRDFDKYTVYEVDATSDEADLDKIREKIAHSRTMDYMRPDLTAHIQKENQIKTLALESGNLASNKLGKLKTAIEFLWGKQYTIEGL